MKGGRGYIFDQVIVNFLFPPGYLATTSTNRRKERINAIVRQHLLRINYVRMSNLEKTSITISIFIGPCIMQKD